MSFWAVVFVVLMLIWLFGGAVAVWPAQPNGPRMYYPIGGHFLAWLCVAILGYLVLHGDSTARNGIGIVVPQTHAQVK